jgi:hypothetical protein
MNGEVSHQPDHEIHFRYGDLWNDEFRVMVDPIDEVAARKRFKKQRGDFYVACGVDPLLAVGDPEVPTELFAGAPDERFSPAVWTLEWSGDGLEAPYYEACFYNVWGSNVASYCFQPWKKSEDLFLHQIEVRTYPNEMRFFHVNECLRIEVTRFNPDGFNLHEDITINPDRSEDVSRVESKGYDVTPHWEPRPEFGDWRGLTRRNRFAN